MAEAGVAKDLCGFGSPDGDLSTQEMRGIVENALSEICAGDKVLAIVPDKTRDDNTDQIFPLAASFLESKKAAKFDVLVAQGTHAPMSPAGKTQKLGIGDGQQIPKLGKVFDHRWNDERELIEIGVLDRERVFEITDGLFDEAIPVRINRLLDPGNYDHVLIFGSTSPHEVAGFSGGAKYFFPGVSGRELTNATHWLGALAGIENMIGRVETPVRHLIETAAGFVSANVICFTSVVTRISDRLRTYALFAGDLRKGFREAAAVSSRVQIKYTGRKYRRVVAVLDVRYDELWLGGKASYKLGGVIEEGGELIIYAPHLSCFSKTHGHLIEKYGYGGITRIKQLVAESADLRDNLCVAAHLAHVVFAERSNGEGSAIPKYEITLATKIDENSCRKANLGYRDPTRFDLEQCATDPDTFVVENAGRDLYLELSNEN